MNIYLLVASVLAFLLGVVHSVMGEVLIFRRMPKNSALLNKAGLPRRYANILWASWHIVSVFGWAIAAALFGLALPYQPDDLAGLATLTIAVATLGASALVLVGTKGRHPGWIVLLIIGALAWFA